MAKALSLGASVRRHREVTVRPLSATDLRRRFQPSPSNSLKALSIKMGPFDAERDAFRFLNKFPITDEQAAEIRRRYRLVTDVMVGAGVQQVRRVLDSLNVNIATDTFGLPNVVVDAVIGKVTTQLAGSLIDKIAGPIPGTFGRCGGMAFAGYDFYLLGWTVDERLGTMPPAGGVLGDYIFSRLLDSLDLNAGKFVDWFMNLHLLPIISGVANAALGAAVGSFAGPVGTAFGALLGDEVKVFKLGGPKVLRDRTKDEWERIKRRLDEQAAWPIGFVYQNSTNPFFDHQLLALDYFQRSNGTATLTVWDNNGVKLSEDVTKPNASLVLELDFRGDELQVGSFNKPVKGIFLEEYSSHQPPDSLRLT